MRRREESFPVLEKEAVARRQPIFLNKTENSIEFSRETKLFDSMPSLNNFDKDKKNVFFILLFFIIVGSAP
jgi:hypothetical protein